MLTCYGKTKRLIFPARYDNGRNLSDTRRWHSSHECTGEGTITTCITFFVTFSTPNGCVLYMKDCRAVPTSGPTAERGTGIQIFKMFL